MRFVYQYRTKENAVRSGEIAASDRETAFQALKTQGIRPAKLEEAPGLFNKLFGKGKRWIAIGILAVIAFALAVQSFRTPPAQQETSSPRHQIYGEPALMEELERSEYADVFALPGERKLAKFAQPGVIQPFKERGWRGEFAAELNVVLTNEIIFVDDERREVRELKMIVNGMKSELRRYLENGIGTTESYVRRLEERQTKELNMYNLAKIELEKETDLEKFEARNAALRAVGLRTIPLPKQEE